MAYVKIRGYAPDAEPTDPGVLVECDKFVPSLRGMESLPGDVDAGWASMSQSVRAATTLTKLDASTRTFAYGTDKVYEAVSNAWTDRSKGAGTYSTSTSARPTFAQYGNQSFLAHADTTIQASTTGAFADLTSAPQAKVVLVSLDFVLGLGISTQVDGWQCSAAGDPGSWTANIATQASSGILYDAPGPITAGGVLQSNVVAFKERSMFLGQYVGPPEVFSFRQIPGEGLGAPGPLAVVDIETALLFPGFDNFYLFDGTRPVPIATNRVAEFFFDDLNFEFAYAITGYHDRQRWRVYWWYPSTSQTDATLDKFLCYNYRSDMWGAGSKTITTVFTWVAPGITYDALGTFYSTWDDLPNAAYNDAFRQATTPQFGIFDTARELKTITGTSATSTFTTGYHGRDDIVQVYDRVRPRFNVACPVSQIRRQSSFCASGAAQYTGEFRQLVNGAYDETWAARWHRWNHSYTGNVEVLGWDVNLRPESIE